MSKKNPQPKPYNTEDNLLAQTFLAQTLLFLRSQNVRCVSFAAIQRALEDKRTMNMEDFFCSGKKTRGLNLESKIGKFANIKFAGEENTSNLISIDDLITDAINTVNRALESEEIEIDRKVFDTLLSSFEGRKNLKGTTEPQTGTLAPLEIDDTDYAQNFKSNFNEKSPEISIHRQGYKHQVLAALSLKTPAIMLFSFMSNMGKMDILNDIEHCFFEYQKKYQYFPPFQRAFRFSHTKVDKSGKIIKRSLKLIDDFTDDFDKLFGTSFSKEEDDTAKLNAIKKELRENRYLIIISGLGKSKIDSKIIDLIRVAFDNNTKSKFIISASDVELFQEFEKNSMIIKVKGMKEVEIREALTKAGKAIDKIPHVDKMIRLLKKETDANFGLINKFIENFKGNYNDTSAVRVCISEIINDSEYKIELTENFNRRLKVVLDNKKNQKDLILEIIYELHENPEGATIDFLVELFSENQTIIEEALETLEKYELAKKEKNGINTTSNSQNQTIIEEALEAKKEKNGTNTTSNSQNQTIIEEALKTKKEINDIYITSNNLFSYMLSSGDYYNANFDKESKLKNRVKQLIEEVKKVGYCFKDIRKLSILDQDWLRISVEHHIEELCKRWKDNKDDKFLANAIYDLTYYTRYYYYVRSGKNHNEYSKIRQDVVEYLDTDLSKYNKIIEANSYLANTLIKCKGDKNEIEKAFKRVDELIKYYSRLNIDAEYAYEMNNYFHAKALFEVYKGEQYEVDSNNYKNHLNVAIKIWKKMETSNKVTKEGQPVQYNTQGRYLAETYAKLEDFKEARKGFNDVLIHAQDPKNNFERGAIFAQCGLIDLDIKAIKKEKANNTILETIKEYLIKVQDDKMKDIVSEAKLYELEGDYYRKIGDMNNAKASYWNAYRYYDPNFEKQYLVQKKIA